MPRKTDGARDPLGYPRGIGPNIPRGARTIAWGSKGPRLCGIGGIGINGVETNRWIMTDVAYVVVIIRLIVSIHLSPVGDGLMETNYDIIT